MMPDTSILLNEVCPPVTDDVRAHMQAQGNLAEYIGIFVVLLAVLELNGASEGACERDCGH